MAGVDPQAETRRLWRLAGMGGTLASEILAGALIGWGLDVLFGTAPTLLVIMTVGGVVVGMITFIRSAMKESSRAGRQAASVRPLPPSPADADDDGWDDEIGDSSPRSPEDPGAVT